MASGASIRLASARARTTPPTSGDTTITFCKLLMRLDVGDHHRRGEQIIGRNIEEALDLPGVEIDASARDRRRRG